MKPLPERRNSDAADDRMSAIGMTALIVDDEWSYRSYIAALAEKVGFTVDEAADAATAQTMLSSTRRDVLIANLDTPGLAALQFNPKETYALVLTSSEDAGKKIAALQAGFDDFLSKSATELEIVAKLVAARRVITRQQTVDHLVRDLYGLASRDELTGLFNRRFLFAETEKLLAGGTAVTLVLFDLDDFKRVNDTFGHPVGDRVLRDVGLLFQRGTRPEDLVGRYGGDEFIMVVTGSPFYLVETISDRLSDDISDLTWTIANDEFSVGVTVGIASSHFLPNATLGQLLEAADRDLYKNKFVKKHPSELRSGVTVDRILPLPQSVSEIENKPAPASTAGRDSARPTRPAR